MNPRFDEALLDAEAAADDARHDLSAARLIAAMRGEDDFTPETYRTARDLFAGEEVHP